jgi:arginyl-tRNA synthetase
MNIFDIYLDKIKKIVISQEENGILKIPENLDVINVDIPPKQFDCDISKYADIVISKINQK